MVCAGQNCTNEFTQYRPQHKFCSLQCKDKAKHLYEKMRGTKHPYDPERSKDNRNWLNNLKSRPCMDCGHLFPVECMQFDHRPDEQKKFTIGHVVHYSRETLALEVAKCDIVCANCHCIRTQARRHK